MHHTMTYGIDLVETLNHTNLRIGEQRENELHTFSMLRDVVHDLLFLTIGQLHLHKGIVQANALSTTASHNALVIHVVQSVLDR